MDREKVEPELLQETTNLHHHHRCENNPSKLPTFRFGDLQRLQCVHHSVSEATKQGTRAIDSATISRRHHSTSTSSSPPTKPGRRQTYPNDDLPALCASNLSDSPSQSTSSSASISKQRRDLQRPRIGPARHSSNGIDTLTGPPPALSTQGSFPPEAQRPQTISTSEWALAQQLLQSPVPPEQNLQNVSTNLSINQNQKPSDDSASPRTLIPPIRSFRSSATRATVDMNNNSYYQQYDSPGAYQHDRDHTLRALEGLTDGEHHTQANKVALEGNREAASSGGDLFLDLARDDLTREANDGNRDSMSRAEMRRSRLALVGNRQSFTPLTSAQSPSMPHRGSDLQHSPSREDDASSKQRSDRLAYQSFPQDRIISNTPINSLNKSRYTPATSRYSSPRSTNNQDQQYESQLTQGGRRPSLPDSNGNMPTRTHSSRQASLSYSAPRVYHSSPLVLKTVEVEDSPETPRIAEGTESTASTTAPSTVWDELDDLKSRIRKLELTGKLPPTSGAAVSRASAERPPTATTTATTMSTSPKRNRGLSTSPVESTHPGVPTSDVHPLLQSALAKSKTLLNPDVYRALEAAAADALTIATMTGNAGNPSSMSSAQSVIGSGTTILSDRQLRRKADSMCRSLTELCLALSDGSQIPAVVQTSSRPGIQDKEYLAGLGDSSPLFQNGPPDSVAHIKTSPSRAMSRLEARRSSMFATSSLPTPRYNPAESVATPTQSSMTGRRTSLLRSRRPDLEEQEEDEEARYRAPSRAATEIGRLSLRSSPRENAPQQIQAEGRSPLLTSNLPIRRQYISTSMSSGMSPMSPASAGLPQVNNRRFLDRSTPERDSNSVVGRLAEDRGKRRPSLVQTLQERGLGRSDTLNRRSRQQNSLELSSDAQMSAYQ